MTTNITINSSAIHAAVCACRWHPLISPDFQRPIDIGHVGNIQNALQQFKDYPDSIVKTITIVNDVGHNKLYILDGQHRYRALLNECALGNHIRFAVQQVQGDYETAHRLYTTMETRALPHDPHVQTTVTPEETQFVYQGKAYLRGLDMKIDGSRRPSVNVDTLFHAYQKTLHPQNITAFKAWIEERNLKIKEAIGRLPQKTMGGPKLLATTLSRCKQYKYWFGLYQPDEYGWINTLTLCVSRDTYLMRLRQNTVNGGI